MTTIEAGSATDVGKVREQNEDAFLQRPPLYAVADGLGGHRGGEVASKLAIETIAERVHEAADLPRAIREANAMVFERQAEDASVRGMGTTVTALFAGDSSTALIAHVGDSRAYLLRDGEIETLTQDHTLVQEMVSEGRISEDEARMHPQKNILTRAVGIEPDLEVDEVTIELQPADRVLLCTDGLTGMIGDDAIRDILAAEKDPAKAATRLVRAAVGAGGFDNVTAVVLHTREGGP